MQLNKYLARCGVSSRRGAVSIIENSRVQVNDKIITEPGFRIQAGTDIVSVDGKRLDIGPDLIYILLNKPDKTLTTVIDERGRKTVTELVDSKERIYPVGRLDQDTTGVLLLTNDGELAYRLAHPKFEVKKVYRAVVENTPDASALSELRKGVEIENNVIVAGEAAVIEKREKSSVVEISIHQGKKHQVKKMFGAVGHPVLTLDRVCFAGLTWDGLEVGEWRELTEKEVTVLYEMVGLNENSGDNR